MPVFQKLTHTYTSELLLCVTNSTDTQGKLMQIEPLLFECE